jgi:hypothetical protein
MRLAVSQLLGLSAREAGCNPFPVREHAVVSNHQRTLRVLKVSGTDRQRDAARTTSAIFPGRCSSEEPAPLLHTRSMGHPMLMSCMRSGVTLRIQKRPQSAGAQLSA